MTFGALIVLAIGVSADAFAVALSQGLRLRENVVRYALTLAAVFGLAQAIMPLLGWLLGSSFADLIQPFDHWIAFGILGAIGLKMIWEAVKPSKDDEVENDAPKLSVRTVALLALATSIDALAVGISLAFLDAQIWFAIALIGVTTFVFSFAAALIGNRVGSKFRKPAEIIGGLVLVGIGTQILIEHLTG